MPNACATRSSGDWACLSGPGLWRLAARPSAAAASSNPGCSGPSAAPMRLSRSAAASSAAISKTTGSRATPEPHFHVAHPIPALTRSPFGRLGAASPGTSRPLFLAGFFPQPHAGAFQFLGDLGQFVRVVVVGGKSGLELLHRSLPLRDGFLGLPELEIDVAQVVMHRGVRSHAVERLHQQLLGLVELALPEAYPP